MIQISESAQSHFRKLIEREALPGLGVRLSAVHPGTARADVRLEFAEPEDLQGDEWAVDCDGFTLWLDAASVTYLDGAEIDYETHATGGQLQIRAPKIKGEVPGRFGLAGRARALAGGERDQPAARTASRPCGGAGSYRRGRGGVTFRRRLPWLRHGRRDA